MFKKIRILWREITTPMPLNNNFSNYDDYWENRGFHQPSLNRAKKIAPYIKEESKVLDIGCGDGTIIKYLDENIKLKKIIGIDISPRAVKYVRKIGYEAEVMDVFSDKFILFLKKNQFDYIIATEILEHLQDPEILIDNLRPNFKENLIVSVPNAGFFVNRIRFLFGSFPLVMIQQHVKEHIRFWTKRDFYYWANYNGYNIEKCIVTSGMGIKPLNFLEKYWQNMFAKQLVYIMRKK